MRLGRLVFEKHGVFWFGPVYTYQLWPQRVRFDRGNW